MNKYTESISTSPFYGAPAIMAMRLENGNLRVSALDIPALQMTEFVKWLRANYPEAFNEL